MESVSATGKKQQSNLSDASPEVAHSAVLLVPGRMLTGRPGVLLGALISAGAFAAFLSTASGLTVSVAGVLSHHVGVSRLGGLRGVHA